MNCLPLTAVGSNPRQGLQNLSCEKAIKLAYGTSVGLLKSPLLPEIIHNGASEVTPRVSP